VAQAGAMVLLLYLIFFLSGAAALTFETLWFRQAGLLFGNGVWASSLVLSSFMAGLAVGNALVVRLDERLGRPTLAYAALELTIGLSGVGLVYGLPLLDGALAPVLGRLLDRPVPLNTLRFSLAFALLLVPATAMGATLPLLVKALHRIDPNLGRVLGRLYGWNTLGAVVGALAGEFFLIEALGVRGTGWAAAGADGMAAAGACALVASAGELAAPPRTGPRAPRPRLRLARPTRRLLAAAFASGAILLALEVVWFRFLLLFVRGSSAVFAAMLATVLAGIALGGFAGASWLGRDPRAHGWARAVSLAGAATCLGVYAAFSGGAPMGLAVFGRAAQLMLPVCLLSGVLFTLLGAALGAQGHAPARAAGLLVLANTVGSAAGSLLGGFVLLPHLGVERSFLVLALAYGGVAALVPGPARPGPVWAARLAGVAVAIALWRFPVGAMEREHLREAAALYLDRDTRVVATREGSVETIQVAETRRFGEPYAYRLITNGYSMSSTGFRGRRYMKLYVLWPAAVHPQLRSALLISYGVGSTAKALTDTRSLERIDVVDISREILETGEIVFPDPREQPLRDPRVSVHVEDGRFFLQTTRRRFDLITGEPPPPKIAGVVNLYTREYFELIRDRLERGGIATYWLPIHSLDPADARAITAAFCAAFDDCSLWNGGAHNWMLVGTRGASGPVSPEDFGRPWRDPVVGEELRGLGLEQPAQLGTLFLADGPDLAAFVAGAPPLDDDHPKRLSSHLDFSRREAAVAFYRRWMDPQAARERFRTSAVADRLWPAALREPTDRAFAWQGLVEEALTQPVDPDTRLPDLHRVLTETSLRTLPLWLLGSDADERRIALRVAASGTPGPDLHERLGRIALAERDYAGAAAHLAQALARCEPPCRAARPLLYALCMGGRLDEAAAAARRLAAADPALASDAAFWHWLESTFPLGRWR
jgi:spermidine synthase